METKGKLIRRVLYALVAVALLSLVGLYTWSKFTESRDRQAILAALPAMPQQESIEPVVYSAIERAHEQIETGSDPVAALGNLARIYQANGFLNEAIQVLDMLLKRDPENPHWPHYLAFILAGYGELEVAIPLWERTIELDPDYMPAHLRRGEALMKLNRMEDAKDAFLRVLIHDPDNPHAFHGLARIYIDEDDYVTALDYLKKSMENSDGSVGIQLMVPVLDKLGHTEQANAIRGMARTLETYSDIPDEWIHELMDYCYDPYQLASGGGFAQYAGNTERAINLMKRAIMYEPDNALVHYQLGVIYQQENQLEDALDYYEKAAELDPKLSDAWLRRATIYLKSGYPDTCDEILARGLANCPTSPALHLMYGERLFAKKQLREAETALKRSIELRPQEPEAYNMLARVYLEENRLLKAKEWSLASLEAEAANPIALSMITLISITLKDEESARKWMEEVRLQPRIKEADRKQMEGFFEQAFGRKP